VKRFESEMITALREMGSEALKTIKESKTLEDGTAAKLKEEISSFKSNLWTGPLAAEAAAALAREAAEAEATEAEAAAEHGAPKKGKKGKKEKKAAAH
ncbi:MAG: hypothetical protein ACRDYV_14890, partial [Acidimicrobiia bacterium]